MLAVISIKIRATQREQNLMAICINFRSAFHGCQIITIDIIKNPIAEKLEFLYVQNLCYHNQ